MTNLGCAGMRSSLGQADTAVSERAAGARRLVDDQQSGDAGIYCQTKVVIACGGIV